MAKLTRRVTSAKTNPAGDWKPRPLAVERIFVFRTEVGLVGKVGVSRRFIGALGAAVLVLAMLAVESPKARAATTALWGFDTASTTSPSFIGQVNSSLGAPQFVGRYIVFDGGTPLQSSEAAFLHSQGLPILLIVSPANSDLTSSSVAVSEANRAVAQANTLGVPRGIALFRDVENSYPISSSYIQSWYTTIMTAGYVPGFYENPLSGSSQFNGAYCGAVAGNAAVGSGTVLYADEQQLNSYTFPRANMPTYGPATPSCVNTTVAWQYKNGYPNPNLDVDEYASQYTNYLWGTSAPPPGGSVVGRSTSGNVAMVVRPNGEAIVVAPNSSGQLIEWQNPAGTQTWTSTAITGAFGKSPSVVLRPSGELDVSYIGTGSTQLWYAWNFADGDPWYVETVTGAYGSDPVMIERPSGETDIAYTGAGGTQIWYAWNFAGQPNWTIETVTGAYGSDLTVSLRPSGEFDIAYVGAGETQLWFAWNIVTQPNWTIETVTGAFGSNPVMVQRPSGETDIAYIGAGGTLIWYASNLQGQGWAIAPTGGYGSDLTAALRPSGEFDIAYIGAAPGEQIWFEWNVSGSWNRAALPGIAGSDLSLAQRSTGETDLAYLGAGSNGQLWYAWNPVIGGTWYGETVPGATGIPS